MNLLLLILYWVFGYTTSLYIVGKRFGVLKIEDIILCGVMDVPANKSFKSWEVPDCMNCCLAMDQEKLEQIGAFQ